MAVMLWQYMHSPRSSTAIRSTKVMQCRRRQQQQHAAGGGLGARPSNSPWRDGVTAYNIEDNELWSRHLLTAVSQITVAVYVFCKSWPSGGDDKKLLAAAILLFIVGVLKCFVKAWAFKRASIYSLASSGATTRQINDGSIEEYVKLARDIVVRQQPEEEDPPGTLTTTQVLHILLCPRGLRGERQQEERLFEERGEASKLFVDLSSAYPRRISIFNKFWGLREDRAYDSVQGGLASAFLLLYTKLKTSLPNGVIHLCILLSPWVLPFASIYLFSHSHKEAYNGTDVKVTNILLCSTAALDIFSWVPVEDGVMDVTDDRRLKILLPPLTVWPETVAQYSLAGYVVRNKKHSNKMRIVSFVGCKDFLDQLWCMDPCFSSARITHLILQYLKDGWRQKIQDATTYRSFNNHSSHWGLNMNRPFDECVLLWHLATDFCFFSTSFSDHRCAFTEPPTRKPPTSRPQCSQESIECKAVQCRQMSNYMVYLLFVNPEMLLPGSRRNLFKTAYDEIKDILKYWERNPICWSRCMPCGVKQIKEEAIVMRRLIQVMQKNTEKRVSQEESSKEAIITEIAITVPQQNSERSSQEGSYSQEGSSMECSNKEENCINQAWALAQRLLEMDEMERSKEIQDVWVQMLCFSASRCRGYLHAKALGKGGEFLSYVWLLLFYMGTETFSEKLQRELLPSCQENFHNGTAPPPTSEVSTTGIGAPSSGSTRAAPSTSEICLVEDNMV